MNDIFVGRQPIFDQQLRVMGYELLYRQTELAVNAEFSNGDQATSEVILNTFGQIGLDRLVGTKKAFINLTRNFFLSNYPIPFSPDRVILEILEDIDPDPEFLTSLARLAKQGYVLAVDDACLPYPYPNLLKLIHILKVDLLATDRALLPAQVAKYRSLNIKLLAEKVETQADFELCRQLGFQYFQGYFLCKPNLVTGKRSTPPRVLIMQLLQRIQDSDVKFEDLENIILQDVNLGYKILVLANSAYFGIPVRIKSIRQAISMLGLRQLRGWLTLFLLTEVDGKPSELTNFAMIRARMCESIAKSMKYSEPDQYFLVGLFSVLDALMDQSMESVLSSISLSEDITNALIFHEGLPGTVLESVLAYEQGNWDAASQNSFSPGILRQAYLDALSWAEQISSAFESPVLTPIG